ncbi:MAG: ABC transporter ATP-binding protein [Actinomycetaceae bacterium]|nr:ABC transporter ATP-binding protein/permease [Arcanobacterium sp.]MDD7504814.1 ABC transporter ATP-binding protein [Actinomycetaceae bacterium]
MKLPVSSNRRVARKLASLFLSFRGEFLFMVAVQLLVALAAVVTPWAIGHTIDAVSSGEPRSVVTRNITIVIVTVVLQAGLGFWAEYLSRVLGQKIFHALRIRLVEQVTHLPLSVVESAGTGDLLGRTTSDVDRVEFVIRRGVSRLLVTVLTIIVTVIAAISVDPKVGFVVLLSFVPWAFALRRYLHRTVAAYLASSAIRAELSGGVTETVEASATVDSLWMGDVRRSSMLIPLREMWANERYTAFQRSLYGMKTIVLLGMPVLIALVWGSWLAGMGLTTVGAVTAVVLYAQQLMGPVDELGWWFDELQFATVAFARIFGVSEVERDERTGDDTPTHDAVSVERVDFSYNPGVPVLKDVSMQIRPGERLAIVGPSGAGKSTLGRLLAGINPPDSGSIRVGGIEVTHLREALLHQTVALVTQENHVFVGTIADNLRLAKPAASDRELEDALDAVDATWVKALGDGIDTVVGSGGKTLPPAQAQQLALARIVLLDPRVVILDEATSLLDPTAARSTERALAQVLEGRTVISIAHRLYTAYDADRVAVMIDGEVAELGSHDELVALGGEYASLWHAWQRD